jgi:hypothetical protein
VLSGGTLQNVKAFCLGVLLWKPAEFAQAAPNDVALAILGSVQHDLWQNYNEAQIAKRLVYGVALWFNGKPIDDAFAFSIGAEQTNEIEDPEIQEQLSNHFPQQWQPINT